MVAEKFKFYIFLLCSLVVLFCVEILCIDIGVETSTGSYERGMFAEWPKKIYFDYYSSPYVNTSDVYISSIMAKEFVDNATSYWIDLEVIPGNTIYFYFSTKLTDTEQQVDNVRTVYISTSWYNEPSITLWSNFFNTPPKVNISTVVITLSGVNLVWQTPKVGNIPLLDLFGGGFEVYKSTDNISFNKIADLPPAWGQNQYKDTQGISMGATYYYKIRSYDAYTIPLYSDFSDTTTVVVLPELIAYPVKLVFNLDMSKVENFSKVYISGNFLSEQLYPMDETKYKIYRFEYYDELKTLKGEEVVYKYFVNNKIPDPYGIRKIKIEDEDNDGVMEIFNIWGVPEVKEKYLPDSIAYLSMDKVDSENNKVVVQFDPEKIVRITTVTVYTQDNKVVVEFQPKTWQEIFYTTYTSCYLELTYDNGKKEKTSLVTLGESIPKKDFVNGYVGDMGSFYPDVVEKRTMVTSFKVPQKLQGLQPTSFVIRYSTYVLTNNLTSYYFDLPVVKKIPSHHPNSVEVCSLKFDSSKGFPSVYLIVSCVYGSNEKIGLLKPAVVVIPEIVHVEESFFGTKGNYTIGFTTGECKATVSIEKYSVKEKVSAYAVVIKNYYELLFDEVLSEKLIQAHTKLQDDYRIKLIGTNLCSLDNYNKNNTIFAFELLLSNDENYFNDTNGDGIPERTLTKDAIIEIPYPPDVNEDKLIICKLNTVGSFWHPVDKQKVEVDKNKKVVRFKTKTFSVYMVAEEGNWASDLSKVEVYPNPFIGSDGRIDNGEFGTGGEYECLNFVHVTENSKIYIFNLAMELVFKEENVKNNSPYPGCYRWDFKDLHGKQVSSGMYFFLIKDDTLPKNNYAKGRFTLVR